MASLGLAPDELKALDSTRNRLFTLSSNLQSLKTQIVQSSHGNTLPPLESLQAQAHILLKNLESLQKTLADHHALFQRVAVHPSTNYPGRTQENILQQLLRKKLEPELENWAEQSRQAALAAGVDPVKLRASGAGLSRANDEDDDDDWYRPEDDADADGALEGDPLSELRADVRVICKERIMRFAHNEYPDPYTAQERALGVENVLTGLLRNLDDDDDDDDDEQDQEDQEDVAMTTTDSDAPAGGPGPGQLVTKYELEHALWFACHGDFDVPPNVEFHSERVRKMAGKS